MQIFGTRDGLLSSKIFTLAQAQNRILWIGTEFGASSYDGYTFTNYQYTSANEPMGRILCVAEDSLHGIWLGGDKGLFYLRNGHLQKMSIENRSSIAVEALVTDGAGNVWIGEINSLYKLTALHIRSSQNLSSLLPIAPYANFRKRVIAIASDNRQNIYVGSYDGVFRIAKDDTKFTALWNNSDVRHYVKSVAATSPDSIYWYCSDSYCMQMIDGKIIKYLPNAFIVHNVFVNDKAPFVLTTSGVAAIKGSFEPIVSFGATTNNAVAALIDVESNIWIATWEGLQKYRKTAFNQYLATPEAHTEIYSMLERKNGELLFGSNHGVLYSKQNNSIIQKKGIPLLFPQAEVLCMYEDVRGGLWAGSGYQCISHLNETKIIHYPDTGFLKDNNCEALYPTVDGKLFACTEHGVTLIDPLASSPMQAHYDYEKRYSRYPELFGCFQISGSNNWFYGSQGLYLLRNGQLIDDDIKGMPIKNLYITKMVADRKGNIWVATLGKGLLQCVLRDGKIVLQQQYDIKKGAHSDIALSVVVDKNDNVWFGDYMSITVIINPGKNEQLTRFSENDGLLSTYYQTLKLEQQKDGTIWGLTSMGLFSFDPDSISRNKLPPVILLNQIRLNGSDSNYAAASTPQFTYDNNSLQFNFTAVSLTDPSKIRYAYRLKGLDTNWTFTNNRVVSFNFLHADKYIFEVKASNNNNVWTNEPIQYRFTILPPFWQRWWFRVVAVLLAAGMIFFVFKRRISSIKNKAAIRQQVAELEAKAIRAQMNPHFIFNSLNAIQELIVTKNFTEAYQYLSSFSKLLRMVLHNSEKNMISLSAEIEMNQHYLKLEALRFKQSFHYEINVDPNIDEETTMVPSLLLQPFLENAIWHGLMPKEGDKKLVVIFTSNADHLICLIEDNGIGREKAAEIKAKKIGASNFESRGMTLSNQRIETLNQQLKENLSIRVEDGKDASGNATGTRVIITIPKQTTFIN